MTDLRDLVRRFAESEIVPHLADWERAGEVPRELHAKAAAIGLLGIGFADDVGGSGGTMVESATVTEELILSGASSGLVAALFTHGIALPHIVAAGDTALIERYVRPTLAGELIGALAVTEPEGGSDVAALRTTARAEGEHYVVNGSKTFITSGARADFATTAVRTGGPGHDGVSLLVIDRAPPTPSHGSGAGFVVSGRLEKMGWHCSDTAELSFMDVRVPRGNLVGAEGSGFRQIMRHFAAERLSMAVQACAMAQRCLALTIAWCQDRQTFGTRLAQRQVVRHRIAELARVTTVARAYVWSLVQRQAGGERLSPVEVAMAKNTAVAACDQVVDGAVQLHGGTGYMRGSEVERHYRDARIMGIGGGATEIMNEIIAKGVLDAH
jgi:acyl-CoA dehydrogenase